MDTNYLKKKIGRTSSHTPSKHLNIMDVNMTLTKPLRIKLFVLKVEFFGSGMSLRGWGGEH